jgi:formylglycine-generating enzyme required for sulfatase activity
MRFPAGQTINHDIANYRANGSAATYDTSTYTTPTYHPDWNDGTLPCTSPVGSFAANGYGLFDMSGNVMERCWDFFAMYSSEMQTDPRGPDSGTQRMRRGGAWDSHPFYCRVASRGYDSPTATDFRTGFRTARSWIP